MSVNLSQPVNILPIKGVRLASAYCGIRKSSKDDLVLIELSNPSHLAAVFTKNAFCAAPVIQAKKNIENCAQSNIKTKYLLINAGNANAGTGQNGLAAAQNCCEAVSGVAECNPEQVLPFSTGVIGEYLPADKIAKALPQLHDRLDENSWLSAAEAIMTTDTLPKACSETVSLACGGIVTITGISKGAGMIKPDMATMLSYIATDANIDHELLEHLLDHCVAKSFNSITVDSDTSTNDACVLMATGEASHSRLTREAIDPKHVDHASYLKLKQALERVFLQLAQAIIRDAEGATKFITINVREGRDTQECKQVGYTIAHSPLVKTALFASDPNWGRILACVGRSNIEGLNVSGVDIFLGDVCIVSGGERAPSYTEEAGAVVMSGTEIEITIRLDRGNAQHTLYTCDLSYDYVRINAEYRT